jgi:2-aminobenzoate-CoA ligase
MFHHFIATAPGDVLANVTGRPIKGFRARVIDAAGADVANGEIGRLAVQGPTGCLYMDDPERQRVYVQDGWNITGDYFSQDPNGGFCFISRSDDMIVSSGYNISGIEVENVMLRHANIMECAVVGLADAERGQVVCAIVVPRQFDGDWVDSDRDNFAQEIQQFVKSEIAPYKYPRQVRFLAELPKTPTGKIQRFKLQQQFSTG